MPGCRPLSNAEAATVLTHLKTPRDKALFIVGMKTGFRISELLSLRIQDVVQGGVVVDRVKVLKRNMKGKNVSREVALHREAKEAILTLVNSLGGVSPEAPLFMSRNGLRKPLSRIQAHVILKTAYMLAKLTGSVATHTLRKSFAKNVYAKLGKDLLQTQHALGHASITSTVKYLPPDQDSIDAAILG